MNDGNVPVRTATFNYLHDKLQIVVLVKFVAEENEAYWVLLRDLPVPDQSNETFTVHIPKLNRLTAIDWNRIQRQVGAVTEVKLRSGRERRNG